MLLFALLGCDCGTRSLAVHVVGLERPVETTLTVEMGSRTLSCALTLAEDGSEWNTLDESGCDEAEILYFSNGELGVVWPSNRAPRRVDVVFEAVGEDGIPYGFDVPDKRVEWSRDAAAVACSEAAGTVWFGPDGGEPVRF